MVYHLDWGEAMSPPVLGTLLGLCVGMLLPKRDFVPPVPRDLGKPLQGDEFVMLQGEHCVGLTGVYIYDHVPGLHQHERCAGCSFTFHGDEAAYIWVGKDAQPYHYHEVCMILHCNAEKAEYNTLDQVRALLSSTDNPKLLESLFDLDDDLSRDATWEIDDTSPEESPVEPTLEAEDRPSKKCKTV